MRKQTTTIESSLMKIEELLKSNGLSTKSYFSFKEACRYLNLSESMLYKLTAGVKIAYSCPNGKLIYFRKVDLDSWMNKGRQETC